MPVLVNVNPTRLSTTKHLRARTDFQWDHCLEEQTDVRNFCTGDSYDGSAGDGADSGRGTDGGASAPPVDVDASDGPAAASSRNPISEIIGGLMGR